MICGGATPLRTTVSSSTSSYFENLTADETEMTPAVTELIERDFGSAEAWEEDLRAAALVGEWVLLTYSQPEKRLRQIVVEENHIGVPLHHTVLLALDCWEACLDGRFSGSHRGLRRRVREVPELESGQSPFEDDSQEEMREHGAMPEYVIAYWKDIPSSVEVGQGGWDCTDTPQLALPKAYRHGGHEAGSDEQRSVFGPLGKTVRGAHERASRVKWQGDIVSELEAQFDDIRLPASEDRAQSLSTGRTYPPVVEAGKGDEAVRVPLSGRFQKLIDAVAMQQGITSTDDYLNHWEKRSGGIRAGEPLEVAEEVAGELENQFDRIRARYG